MDSTFEYRDLNKTKTASLYNRYIQFKRVLGDVKIVGITPDTQADLYLSEEGSRALEKELSYFSGGVAAYNLNSNATAKSLIRSDTKTTIGTIERIRQFAEIRSSSLSHLLMVVSLSMGILFELGLFAFEVTLINFRKNNLKAMFAMGIPLDPFSLEFNHYSSFSQRFLEP